MGKTHRDRPDYTPTTKKGGKKSSNKKIKKTKEDWD